MNLKNKDLVRQKFCGVEVFTQFLRSQFSEENIEFWLACEDFKTTESATKLQSKAKQIHAIFIDKEAPKEINIDHSTKATIEKNILKPTRSCFDAAQSKIYSLMKRDCYPRFLSSDIYLTLTKRAAPLFPFCLKHPIWFRFDETPPSKIRNVL
uniref:Regulator of G protein signaling 18 n=1 Tax=Cyprinus carpio TaxID=7962 RepID=A0A8C1TNW7_CYPCA